MSKAEIFAGVSSFNTTVNARRNEHGCVLDIQSECRHPTPGRAP